MKNSSTTTTTNNKKQPKSRKRPRPTVQEEAQDYFNRLEYKCQKDWNKHIKATKKLEVLKLNKRLQQERNRVAADDAVDTNPGPSSTTANSVSPTSSSATAVAATSMSKSNKKVDQLEEQVQALKTLEVPVMVDEALRRLGVRNLNPSLLVLSSSSLPDSGHISENSHDNNSNDGDNEEKDNNADAKNDSLLDDNDDGNSGTTDEQLEPKPAHPVTTATTTARTPTTTTVPPLTEQQMPLMERILSQSRSVKLTEDWIQEISNYRQWHTQRLEQEQARNDTSHAAHKKKNSSHQQNGANQNKRKNSKRPARDQEAADERAYLTHGQSIFLQLGNTGDEEQEGRMDDNLAGEEEDGFALAAAALTRRKKNRPGQRARKAKAVAKEQQEQHGGKRQYHHPGSSNNTEDSLNWRGRKNQKNSNKFHKQETGDGRPPRSQAPTTPSANKPAHSTNNTSNDGAESLHPSWAARKAQSDGIVQFQGKKITFDD
mmetsp:Transcript_31066/g.72948  ORF Transcript_31066/g.72948 Transcript_31066/m.72948 type:complete len:487 (-) Transcript_31066:60-1520(-)